MNTASRVPGAAGIKSGASNGFETGLPARLSLLELVWELDVLRIDFAGRTDDSRQQFRGIAAARPQVGDLHPGLHTEERHHLRGLARRVRIAVSGRPRRRVDRIGDVARNLCRGQYALVLHSGCSD